MGIVELKDVSRVYRNGDHEQRALDHVDLSLEEGKFIVVSILRRKSVLESNMVQTIGSAGESLAGGRHRHDPASGCGGAVVQQGNKEKIKKCHAPYTPANFCVITRGRSGLPSVFRLQNGRQRCSGHSRLQWRSGSPARCRS